MQLRLRSESVVYIPGLDVLHALQKPLPTGGLLHFIATDGLPRLSYLGFHSHN